MESPRRGSLQLLVVLVLTQVLLVLGMEGMAGAGVLGT
jgi:hypothetical protein